MNLGAAHEYAPKAQKNLVAAFCDGCGNPVADGDHARCRARRAATDPPRFCTECARKLVVQVLPTGYTARCVRCGVL
ncbi:MAG: hypothetical protein WKF94_09435 [Solirubrobacteraceae bacterium]